MCGLALVMNVLGRPQSTTQTTSGQSPPQTTDQATMQPSAHTSHTAAADNTESEITTRVTDAQIKVHVNLVLVRAVVRDAGGEEVAGLKRDVQRRDSRNATN